MPIEVELVVPALSVFQVVTKSVVFIASAATKCGAIIPMAHANATASVITSFPLPIAFKIFVPSNAYGKTIAHIVNEFNRFIAQKYVYQ